MRKIYCFLMALGCLVLAACASEPLPSGSSELEPPSSVEYVEPEETYYRGYLPEENMSKEEIIEAYFEQQYLAYVDLAYCDVTSLLNMERNYNVSFDSWSQMLALRRRVIAENNYCYVEQEKFPYTIIYDEVPDDNREELWRADGSLTLEDTLVHFRIVGEENAVYPAIMATDTQHTMAMQLVDGQWQIQFHFFAGAGQYLQGDTMDSVPTQSQMETLLKEEFSNSIENNDASIPENSNPLLVWYQGERAAEYAKEYRVVGNPEFYRIGDLVGNCANYISQAMWYGFGEQGMSADWYAQDGGTPAWENVNFFWNYMTEENHIFGEVLTSPNALKVGDVVQTRPLSHPEERFKHMLMVVDEDTLLLTQNSPNNLIYYSDLVSYEMRYFHPIYFVDETE